MQRAPYTSFWEDSDNKIVQKSIQNGKMKIRSEISSRNKILEEYTGNSPPCTHRTVVADSSMLSD